MVGASGSANQTCDMGRHTLKDTSVWETDFREECGNWKIRKEEMLWTGYVDNGWNIGISMGIIRSGQIQVVL